jgi:primosomal replication protein N''
MSNALNKLNEQINQLRIQACQFDKAKWFEKNKYIQAQPSLFDRTVFATKSLLLIDYIDEIEAEIKHLPHSDKRHEFAFALSRITAQVEAIIKVLKSTPVWAKENKFTYPKKAKVYKKTIQKIMQSSHELYQELSQNHEFERRLLEMIALKKQQMHNASIDQVNTLNKEVLVLHGRLGRCRKAISATEDKIQLAEKQQNR